MNYRRMVALLATALLFGCGPSETDKANMKEKLDLETQRAKIWTANLKSCPTLVSESTAFRDKHAERAKAIDVWWGGLGKGPKDKLIEANRAEWDAQSNALVQLAGACP